MLKAQAGKPSNVSISCAVTTRRQDYIERVATSLWGAHAPRVLAIAPSRSRTFHKGDFGEGAEIGTRGRVRSPEMKLPSLHFKGIQGSICAPRGFRCAAVFCDIKTLGTGKGSEKGQKRDLALIVSDVPATVAGMFTTNQVAAAPVRLSAERAAKKSVRAIVVNSGNANACTGAQGMRDAEAMARTAAEIVANRSVIDRRYRRVSAGDVLVCSTGRIGVPMPMKNIQRGIRECAPLLATSSENARQVAEAIMTTDTQRKEIAVEFKIGKSTVRIGGICKGAGMIHPGMSDANFVATALRRRARAPRLSGAATGHPRQHGSATKHATMLAFITSDVAIASSALKRALKAAVPQSFNRITIDGDTSTNDSVIALANGLAGNRTIENRDSRLGIFQQALDHVTLELARMIVRDGEGVSRFVTLHVHGACNARDADAAARAIANSSLVRTSWCGGDPNWGRVLCALGYSGARVNQSIVDIGYAKPGSREIIFAFRHGRPTNVALKTLHQVTSAAEFDLHVNLRLGRAEFTMYASDLTERYVALNKGDVNDPTTLGG